MENNPFTILVVDDEADYRKSLKRILELEGFSVQTVGSGEEALFEIKKRRFDLVLTDLMMEGMDGHALLEAVQKEQPELDVILITAHATIPGAVEAMKKGAFSYFVKGNDPEELIAEVIRVQERCQRRHENAVLLLKNDRILFESQSPTFIKVATMARKAAMSNANILLTGESGTGKEVFARYIHQCSERSANPFVAVNCHSLKETLLESELFGHKKGAFTGANEDRVGRVEAAQKGTLFLDEIADAPVSTQIKLLRTLENRQIERIGSNQPVDVDFRLVSATNRNLKQLIETGEFREDFYFRLSTIVLELPPLRERREDIPTLARQFMRQVAVEMNKEVIDFTPETLEYLVHYTYPGNVRELKNMIERMVVFSEDGMLRVDELSGVEAVEKQEESTLRAVRQKAEREWIVKVLEKNEYAMGKSADELGITRRQLLNKVLEYGIRK